MNGNPLLDVEAAAYSVCKRRSMSAGKPSGFRQYDKYICIGCDADALMTLLFYCLFSSNLHDKERFIKQAERKEDFS